MTTYVRPEAPEGYEPLSMGLVGKGHRDVYSAALSLARNRAGKVAKLDVAGHRVLAGKYLADLNADVEDFIARHKYETGFATWLREKSDPSRSDYYHQAGVATPSNGLGEE